MKNLGNHWADSEVIALEIYQLICSCDTSDGNIEKIRNKIYKLNNKFERIKISKNPGRRKNKSAKN